ncbi:PadR family transcriptional regulator [Actinocrispum wychmicini]|uniref:PadR family transcriptional regulator n=1 Tax=Actinocrispum wychmicini TaxID=1213861 RepID=A0A4R2JJG8_9PSEU|nr:helix-turn-helix transcriptional regulator [Actinocrispum wychmicini]TCO57156.1 PadR family transcriptional regulator [Actinocrispum wychmicini]
MVAVRMTLQTRLVLRVLLDAPEDQRLYGLEISRTTGLLTATIYPILTRLEVAGWVESCWEDINPAAEGRPRRRYYQMPIAGRLHAATELQRADEAEATRRRQ